MIKFDQIKVNLPAARPRLVLKGQVFVVRGGLCFTDPEDMEMVQVEIKDILSGYVRQKNNEQTRMAIKCEMRRLLDHLELQANISVREKVLHEGKKAWIFTENGIQEYQLTQDITDPTAVDIILEEPNES